MNLPELITRLREAIDNMGDYARMANIKATGSLAVLNEGVEALEQLAAALAAKDEALALARKEFEGLPHSLGYEFTHVPKIDAAIALQPHAELVAKMKSDAVREAAGHVGGETFDKLHDLADRIERGEVK